MDIKQLRYFITIAEEGSLSAAAQRLRLAQPSLSQHVVRIEQELGVAMISRSSRGVELTPSGEILLEHARVICDSMDAFHERVKAPGQALEGSVAFGLPSSISMVLAVPLAETIRRRLPKVKMRTVEAMSGFIRQWLQDETIDLGFLYDLDEARQFEARELMQEDLHFFAAAGAWPLSRPVGEPAPLAEIAGLDLILPSQHHGMRRTIETYALARGLALNVGVEMDALEQIKELVARGGGFTILAAAAAHDRVMRGELVTSPIVEPVLTRPIYLARKLTRPQTYVSREVERITLEVIDDLVARGVWQASRTPEGR